jgi:RNA polymerase sigma-70 factor (ECF subfamily)
MRSRGGPKEGASETRLLEGLKNGDQEAVKTLMRKYHDRLFAVANRICNNPADAEEILQDVYMTALNKIDRFEQRSTLATWLHRITVNTALMKLRNQRLVHKNSVPMDDVHVALAESRSGVLSGEGVGSPDDTFMSTELCEQVRDTVEGLPEVYRNVFLLRGIQGLSTKETGRILNVTPAAIKSRLHRSRTLIKERLDPYLEQ